MATPIADILLLLSTRSADPLSLTAEPPPHVPFLTPDLTSYCRPGFGLRRPRLTAARTILRPR